MFNIINKLQAGEIFHVVYQMGLFLNPLLFLIYINDISQLSDKRFAVLFADDSNMFITGKNILELAKSMNEELKSISGWKQINFHSTFQKHITWCFQT